MYKKLVYDHGFFSFMAKKNTTSSNLKRILSLVSYLLKFKVLTIPLFILERLAAFILILPVPIYSNLIYVIVKSINGFFGFYIRSLYYSSKAKKWGGNIIIEEGVVLENIQNYEIDEHVLIDKHVVIYSDELKVGKGTHIAIGVVISPGGSAIIEEYVGISFCSVLITASDTYKGGYRTSGPMVPDEHRNVTRGEIVIKRDVLLGPNVVIMPNVTIGEGTIIAPNSTVIRNINAWEIWCPDKIKKLGDRDKVKFPEPNYK